MRMKWLFVVVLLCFIMSTVSGAAEFKDTVQYHTALSESWSGDGTIVNYPAAYPYSKAIELYSGGLKSATTINKTLSDYWSFYVRDHSGTDYGDEFLGVLFYDEDGGLIPSGHISMFWGGNDAYVLREVHLTTNIQHIGHSGYIELQREGDQMYLRVDGVDKGSLGPCTKRPAYMRISNNRAHSSKYIATRFDSITTGDGIVGIGHQANPLHSVTEVANNELDVEWTLKSIPFSEYTNSQYDMKVKRATWNEFYNVTTIKAAGDSVTLPRGFVKYNWSSLFQANHFGLYWFETYKSGSGEPELIDQDWIFYKDIGEPSTINIEDTEYAIGEAMNISYYIDSPDFGANQYKIQIFDATGQLKDERVLTMQAATEQITSTIDWEEGMLYAVLVKDTKPAIIEDPPEDIIDLAYDFCTLSNVIYITGKVYDASNADNLVDGTLLDNVSLNWTQAGTIYNTTSDANGNYEFTDPTTLLEIEWFQDVPITVHAEKTGYTHSDFDMTIIKAGRYTVDIYMTPPYDYENISISGVVADDIFHQAIPYAEVHIWNATWSNTTYTNTWGWYEFNNLTNGTYNMYAKKETYRQSGTIQVSAWNMSLTLDSCDTLDYVESTLDTCDSVTGWNSDNTLTLNTTDYIKGTGSLQSVGTNTMDFNKTFSAFNSNVTKEGYFYFYSKIDNTTNISSVNVTVTLSSNATGTTDTLVWEINKTLFTDTWNLTFLELSQAVETGTCDLSAIRFFELESTKSASITTKIDFLAFIEYVDWNSNINLSLDTSDKQEGTASILASGKAWIPGSYDHYFGWSPGGTIPPPPDVPIPEYWVDRYWSAPPPGANSFSSSNELGRLQIWYKPDHTKDRDIILASGDTTNYLYWQDVGTVGSWNLERLFFKDAYENGTMNFGGIQWFVLLGNRSGSADAEDRIDNIELVQTGGTRQNFFLGKYYDLTVHAKDMDTRYTITSFTAILDSTTVVETTTGAIVFPNVTYGIYPLEVSANGYYTNKQYVFMGQDTEQTVYLTKIENVSTTGVGQAYAPIPVEFRVINIGGIPKSNVNVSAVGIETTMGAWSWLQDIFGYSSKVELQNTSMNGTTDSMGHLTFVMVETIKYKIDFTKPSEGINETLYFYPKEKQYTIVVTSPRAPSMIDYVDWNLSVQPENSTHSNLTLFYNDTMAQTSNLRFFVKDENRSEIYNQSFSSESIISVGYLVNKSSGQSYFWGFNVTHDEFDEFKATKAITFKSRLIDLKLKPGNENYYTWISVCLLVMISTLFSAVTSKFGYVVIPFMGGFFYWIGWLEISAVILSVVMFFGVILYMGKKERESGL